MIFERVAPVLPVRDVAAALARYRRLGFEGTAYVAPESTEADPIYGFLQRGLVELHLTRYPELDPKTTTSVCYLVVDDVDAVYAAWREAGVEGRLRAPEDRAYGFREFGYVDPDGNLLRVSTRR